MVDLLDMAPEIEAGPPPYTLADLEATSLHTVSTAVAAAALTRTESRGCHRRTDHPATVAGWHRRLQVRAEGDTVVISAGTDIAS